MEISGAYIVSRGRRGRGRPPKHRGAAALIFILLLLTSAIVALAFILPRLSSPSQKASGAGRFGGKTFYALCTGSSEAREVAMLYVTDTANRGGAGYLYNDGTYRAVAAVYERESDAKALSGVNEGSSYFALTIPALSCDDGTKRALEYICGEWFTALDGVISSLDKGAATESGADKEVSDAFMSLSTYINGMSDSPLKRALYTVCDYDIAAAGSRSTVSYMRFCEVRVIFTLFIYAK